MLVNVSRAASTFDRPVKGESGKIANTPKTIASSFNSYFSNIDFKLKNEINATSMTAYTKSLKKILLVTDCI